MLKATLSPLHPVTGSIVSCTSRICWLAANRMENQQPLLRHPQSHLFTVRLWIETLGHGQEEVRMQVRHVLSGETRYFRDGSLLLAYLLTKLQEVERTGPVGDESP
jgi:hypothetical protein